jgi:hypothetical protein
LYVIGAEEIKYGHQIWKSVLQFRKLLEKSEKLINKKEYDIMVNTKGISKDMIEQFCIDNKFVLEI